MLRVPAPISRLVAEHVLGGARVRLPEEDTINDFVDTMVGSLIVISGYLMHIAGLGALKFLSDREAKAAAPRPWWRMNQSWVAVGSIIISWFFISIGEIVIHHRLVVVLIAPMSLAFMVAFAAYFLEEAVSPKDLYILLLIAAGTIVIDVGALAEDSGDSISVFVAFIYMLLVAILAVLSICALFKVRKTVAQLGLKHESNKVYRTWLPFVYGATGGLVDSFGYLFSLLILYIMSTYIGHFVAPLVGLGVILIFFFAGQLVQVHTLVLAFHDFEMMGVVPAYLVVQTVFDNVPYLLKGFEPFGIFPLFYFGVALSVIGIFLLAVMRDVFHNYAELGAEADDEDVEVDRFGDDERDEPSAPPSDSASAPAEDDGPGAPPDVAALDSIAL